MRSVTHYLSLLVPPSARRQARSLFPGLYRRLYNFTYSDDEPTAQTIKSGRLAGRRLICRPRLESHYLSGNYEVPVQEALAKYVRPGMVVYDVGVHRGYFSLLCAALVGETGRVFSFEPLPGNQNLARKSFELNPDLGSRITLVHAAVSDTSGVATLVLIEEYSSMARLSRTEADETSGRIEVKTISLDDFIANGNQPPQFIKMDIEGAETRAFMGMSRLMSEARPILLVEIHDQPAWAAFTALLKTHRYQGARLDETTLSDRPVWIERDMYVAVPGAVA